MDLIFNYIRDHPYVSQKTLRVELKNAVFSFPLNIEVLKKYIDLNAFGLRLIHLRRFLEEKVSG